MSVLPALLLSLAYLTDGTCGYITCDNLSRSTQICGCNCLNVKSEVYTSLRDLYLYNSLFLTFIPESAESIQIDNICYTFFPKNNDPNTEDLYISRVYKNGTNEVLYTVVTNETLGVYRTKGSGCNFRDTIIGSSRCDATITYRCYSCIGCQNRLSGYTGHAAFGLSLAYGPVSDCCLQEAQQVLQDSGVPPQKYTAFPMRLPPRCVKNPNRCIAGAGYSRY